MCVIFTKKEMPGQNTMFKLTYQAYIMFAMTMGYSIYRLLVVSKQLIFKLISGICLFFPCVDSGIFRKECEFLVRKCSGSVRISGTFALGYLDTDFSRGCICYYVAEGKCEGFPVVLEANGDSYTGV